MESNHSLNEKQLKRLKKYFNALSDDNGATISVDNVVKVIRMLNQNPTNKDIANAIQNVDVKNNNGRLSFEETVKIGLLCWKNNENVEDELKNAFKAFDKNGTGSVNKDKFRKYMISRGEYLSEQEADDLINLVSQHDGDIDISSLIELFIQNPNLSILETSILEKQSLNQSLVKNEKSFQKHDVSVNEKQNLAKDEKSFQKHDVSIHEKQSLAKDEKSFQKHDVSVNEKQSLNQSLVKQVETSIYEMSTNGDNLQEVIKKVDVEHEQSKHEISTNSHELEKTITLKEDNQVE